jgi:ABC-type transport system involved in multi-copper enzyme maturation permease subunit
MTNLTYSVTTGVPTRQRFGNVIRSEVTKLRTLRSTTWVLLITTVGALLITSLSANHAATRSNRNFDGFDPTNMSLTGLFLASLTIGVLGVLAISGEYGSGTIRSSLSATPRRGIFAVSKVAVVGLLSLLVGEALTFACFFLGQGILTGSGAPTASLGQPGVLQALLLSGAYLALLALFALGIGLIVRHTAGAIATFVGFTLLLPLLLQTLGNSVQRFAPENIFANSVAAVVPNSGEFTAWTGFLLMTAYAIVSLTIGLVLLARRDA